jgi:hypothetical protein
VRDAIVEQRNFIAGDKREAEVMVSSCFSRRLARRSSVTLIPFWEFAGF